MERRGAGRCWIAAVQGNCLVEFTVLEENYDSNDTNLSKQKEGASG